MNSHSPKGATPGLDFPTRLKILPLANCVYRSLFYTLFGKCFIFCCSSKCFLRKEEDHPPKSNDILIGTKYITTEFVWKNASPMRVQSIYMKKNERVQSRDIYIVRACVFFPQTPTCKERIHVIDFVPNDPRRFTCPMATERNEALRCLFFVGSFLTWTFCVCFFSEFNPRHFRRREHRKCEMPIHGSQFGKRVFEKKARNG